MEICLSWLFYRVSETKFPKKLVVLQRSRIITAWEFAFSHTKIVPRTNPLFCSLEILHDGHDPSGQSSPNSWYVHLVLGGSDESTVSPENIQVLDLTDHWKLIFVFHNIEILIFERLNNFHYYAASSTW